MIGLFEVSATKAGKTISCTMFGNIAEKEQLFGELMNQHKIDKVNGICGNCQTSPQNTIVLIMTHFKRV